MGVTAKVEAFDRLVEPFRAELLAYRYRMLGSAHDAQDFVQDTNLRAWRARQQYDQARSSGAGRRRTLCLNQVRQATGIRCPGHGKRAEPQPAQPPPLCFALPLRPK